MLCLNIGHRMWQQAYLGVNRNYIHSFNTLHYVCEKKLRTWSYLVEGNDLKLLKKENVGLEIQSE